MKSRSHSGVRRIFSPVTKRTAPQHVHVTWTAPKPLAFDHTVATVVIWPLPQWCVFSENQETELRCDSSLSLPLGFTIAVCEPLQGSTEENAGRE